VSEVRNGRHGQFTERHHDGALATRANNRHGYVLARLQSCDRIRKVLLVAARKPINPHDHIALPQARLVRRSPRHGRTDEHATRHTQPQLIRQLGRDLLQRRDAEVGPPAVHHFTVLDELAHDDGDAVAGNGEADALSHAPNTSSPSS
jgi:hypothetical protein